MAIPSINVFYNTFHKGANNVDPYQTAHSKQSDQGLDCLVRLFCPNKESYGD